MEGQHQAPQNNGTTTPNDVVSPHSPLPPPPGRTHHDNTYIVQFPKDQVYRIPPSENALIVESYRNPPTKDKKKPRDCGCCCPRFLLIFAIILVTIIAVVGITLAALFFIFNPKGPTFTITRFAVNNVTKPPHYEISLRAKNPNKRLGIVYVSSVVSMLFDDTEVATGKFPKLSEQGRGALTQFKVDVTGKNKAMPKKMENTPVDFELEMNLRVRVTASGLKTWIMKSNIVCNFEVNNLGSNSRILSQACDTNFKHY